MIVPDHILRTWIARGGVQYTFYDPQDAGRIGPVLPKGWPCGVPPVDPVGPASLDVHLGAFCTVPLPRAGRTVLSINSAGAIFCMLSRTGQELMGI